MTHRLLTSLAVVCCLAPLAAPAWGQAAFWEERFSEFEEGSLITAGESEWVPAGGPNSQMPTIVSVAGDLAAELRETRTGTTARALPGTFTSAGGTNLFVGMTVRFVELPQEAPFFQFNRNSPVGRVWARGVGGQIQLGVTSGSEDPAEVRWVPFREFRLNLNQPTRLVVGLFRIDQEWRAQLWIGPTSPTAEQQVIAQDTTGRAVGEVALLQRPGIGAVQVDDITPSSTFNSARLLPTRAPILIDNNSVFRNVAATTVPNAFVGDFNTNVSAGNSDVITAVNWRIDSEGDLAAVRRVAIYRESDTPQEANFDGQNVNYLRAPTTTDTLIAEVLDPFSGGSGTSGAQTTPVAPQPSISDGNPTRLYVIVDLENASPGSSYTFVLLGLQTGDSLPYNGPKLLGTNLLVEQGGGDGVVLNEIKANPPGESAAHQFIEIRGPAGQQLTNVYVYGIEGAAAASYRRGVIDFVIDLSQHSLGGNGLLLIVPGQNPYTVGEQTTVVVSDQLQLGPGARTVWLVLGTSRPRHNADDGNGLIDIDTNGDGTSNQMPLGISVIDAVGWSNGSEEDRVYGPDLTTSLNMPGAPDAAVRFAGDSNTSSASSWYAGRLEGAPGDNEFATTGRSSNFPENGRLTPGRVNGQAPGAGSGGSGSGDGGCAALLRGATAGSGAIVLAWLLASCVLLLAGARRLRRTGCERVGDAV